MDGNGGTENVTQCILFCKKMDFFSENTSKIKRNNIIET